MKTARIGITGPIGCGKSTVAGMLGELGATVVDADDVARQVRREPDVSRRIAERFGTVDPAALSAVVFGDAAAMADLEAIVHPAVRPRILAAIDSAEASRVPAVVIEAIKLVEGGLAALCDEVWLVTCDPAVQRGRLRERGLGDADADRRMTAQRHLRDRVEPVATRRIDTSGTLAETRAEVTRAWANLTR